jgi:hypothetical protein
LAAADGEPAGVTVFSGATEAICARERLEYAFMYVGSLGFRPLVLAQQPQEAMDFLTNVPAKHPYTTAALAVALVALFWNILRGKKALHLQGILKPHLCIILVNIGHKSASRSPRDYIGSEHRVGICLGGTHCERR